jgi:hypothetical protein
VNSGQWTVKARGFGWWSWIDCAPEEGNYLQLQRGIILKTAVDPFSIWVSCGAVQKSTVGKGRTMVFRHAEVLQGLKPFLYFMRLTTRLKSCPDASCLLNEFFRSL